MDYRHYRGEGIKIPPEIRRHLHKLRPVGVVCLLAGVAIPGLIVIKLLESTFLINFLAYTLMVLGPIFYLVGLANDSYADRSE
jgi:hypothetical protein